MEIPGAERLAVPEREGELRPAGRPCPGTAASPGSAEPLRRQVRAGGAARRNKAKPRTSQHGFGALLWSSQRVCCGSAVCESACVSVPVCACVCVCLYPCAPVRTEGGGAPKQAAIFHYNLAMLEESPGGPSRAVC